MNLKPEQKDFIISLSNEMRTQDTRCTAQPYGLILTEEVIEVRGKDHGSNCGAYWDEHEYLTDYKRFQDDVAGYYIDDDAPMWVKKVMDCHSFSDLEDELDYKDIDNVPTIFWYEKTQVPTLMDSNFFLTNKGYEEHIKINGHNLKKPQSYGIHLFRNKEMAQVIEVIHAIAEQLSSNTEQVKMCDVFDTEQQLYSVIKCLYESIKLMHPNDGLSAPRDFELAKEINKKAAIMDKVQEAMRIINPAFEIREG